MISFDGKQLSNLVEGHITVVISVVVVLVLTYVILIPVILGVLGGLFFLLIVFLFATRTGLKFTLFGGHKEGPDKCENSQIKHDEPTTLSGKWACSSEQLPSQGQGLGTIRSLSNDFKVFEKEELVIATENFHHNNHLGQGAFGAVYKGTTSQGSEIAVKKLSLNSKQGKDEFVNEIRLVAKVRHRNLVKLHGCCAEGSERLIVYEYLPNNSLYTFLFDPNKRSHLDWEKRYSIILGVSRGLLYLHEDSPLRIIHRDIKAGNILLDTKFNPKIADFGIARLLEEGESHVRTRPAGTRGYWAPEYAMEGQLSVKADVYSFGILLLELISGRKSIDFNLEDEMQVLSDWVKRLNREGNLETMIDPVIIETCGDKKEQVLRCIHVGLSCIQAEASLRPPMSSINMMLSTQFMNSTHPTKPDIETCRITPDTKSTVICGPSQAYSQNDPLVSSPSARIHISSPSSTSTTQSSSVSTSSHAPLLPTDRVPSRTGPEKSKFWKGKFWGAKFWNSKKAKTGESKPSSRDTIFSSPSTQTISSLSGTTLSESFPSTPRPEGRIMPSANLKAFSFNDLKNATRNFRPDSVLGQGGFGSVFKGWIDEHGFMAAKPGTGMVIAVKKLNQESLQGRDEWLAEVNYLGQLSHPNLVKLVGYCAEDDHLLLVYEFMPKGSLENHLFRKGSYYQPLSWALRIKIALGAARGLAFLHDAKPQVIYRDFKTSNILLDSNYSAKLSDFGLAKNGPQGSDTHVSTRIMGTYGYAAPEYMATGHLTAKSDVYGFGVVLLEMLSGERAIDINRPAGQHKLVEWLKPYLSDKRKLFRVMDSRLDGHYPSKGAYKAAILALHCLTPEAKQRPRMSEVVEKLEVIQSIKDTSKYSQRDGPGNGNGNRNLNHSPQNMPYRSPGHPRQNGSPLHSHARSPRQR